MTTNNKITRRKTKINDVSQVGIYDLLYYILSYFSWFSARL